MDKSSYKSAEAQGKEKKQITALLETTRQDNGTMEAKYTDITGYKYTFTFDGAKMF